jgi:ribose transport system ATP-binding protein
VSEITPVEDGPLVRVQNAVKTYGPTKALSGVTLSVHAGEVLGIVGHNGAGKSTLMRVLCGLEALDSGFVEIGGITTPPHAGYPGVRMAYQEGSLALELSVRENIYLSSTAWMPRLRWRRTAGEHAAARLKEIFPDNTIQPSDYVDDLTLADRQRVEIARATISNDLRVLILDEPTESLSGSAVDQLYDYVRKLRANGLAIVLVSHRLREILSVCDRVAVMKDGGVVSVHHAADVTEQDLFMAMGGEVAVAEARRAANSPATNGSRPVVVRIPMMSVDAVAIEIIAHKGEVVGLAGIAGQGQEQVLDRLWRRSRGDIELSGDPAYVPGDRQRSGILPLWDVAANLSITALPNLARRGIRQVDLEASLVSRWVDLLKVRVARVQPSPAFRAAISRRLSWREPSRPKPMSFC